MSGNRIFIEPGDSEVAIHTFSADTLDDLLNRVFRALQLADSCVRTSRGETLELSAVTLELNDPLARLSRSEARGRIFSCLGEFFWYLAGDDSASAIEYYIKEYKKEAVGGKILSAYGPRLFTDSGNGGQVKRVIELLRERPTTRRAVLQLFSEKDLIRPSGDVPCTCTVQLLVRKGRLDAITYMRSNDAVRGLSHDIFCFTMLQEVLARSLNLGLGRYIHIAGSLHLYTSDLEQVDTFLGEGFHSRKSPMREMPREDPWIAISTMINIESELRNGKILSDEKLGALPEYWQELALLFAAFSAYRYQDSERLSHIARSLGNTVYFPFLAELSSRGK